MPFRFSQNCNREKTNTQVKIRTTSPYLHCMSNAKALYFCNCFSRSLFRWMLLIKRMQWRSRNMLHHSPVSFRCTNIAVLNNGGLRLISSGKAPMKKTIFLTVRFLDFLADFLTMNMNIQQSNFMLKTFQENVKIRLKHVEKIQDTPLYLC